MHSLLDPAILFFLLGAFAGGVRSNLEVPPAVARFLSLYLLMALGLKGGFALREAGLTGAVAASLGLALLLAIVVPAVGYLVLRRMVSSYDAAALAATYGSVSAVTFITAAQYLDTHAVEYGGHMPAALALMESPAIVMAVALANHARRASGSPEAASHGSVLRESFTEGAQMLLLGAMVIGMATGPTGEAVMKPFTGDLFKGMLAFFLLDMGIAAARHARGLVGLPAALFAYAVLGPLVHAALAFALARAAGLAQGDATLLMVLAASASYIAVPAVVRHAIPEANPSIYLSLSLGLTFPFNIIAGIPLYAWAARSF